MEVSQILKGHNDLMLDFDILLPHEYKIEVCYYLNHFEILVFKFYYFTDKNKLKTNQYFLFWQFFDAIDITHFFCKFNAVYFNFFLFQNRKLKRKVVE